MTAWICGSMALCVCRKRTSPPQLQDFLEPAALNSCTGRALGGDRAGGVLMRPVVAGPTYSSDGALRSLTCKTIHHKFESTLESGAFHIQMYILKNLPI